MRLVSALAYDFNDGVRSRGAAYFRSGAVRIAQGTESTVVAYVRGSRTYDVEITWDGKHLVLFCDCPYFETDGPCKHLWATILAGDAHNYLSAMTRFDRSLVRYDMPDDANQDLPDREEYDEEEDEGEGIENDNVYRTTYKSPYFQQPSSVPAWKKHVQQLVAAEVQPSEGWPSSRELLYVIDPRSSQVGGALMLELLTREPKKAGGWKKPALPRLQYAEIDRLPNALDREILTLLTGSTGQPEWMFGSDYNTVPVTFRLLGKFAANTMPIIASTGRCVLGESEVDPEIKPLVWDDGDPWSFRIRMCSGDEGKYRLNGCLRREAMEIDLNDPDLITQGIVIFNGRISRLDDRAPLRAIAAMRKIERIEVPGNQAGDMLGALLEHTIADHLELPEDLRFEQIRPALRPCVSIFFENDRRWETEKVKLLLSFDYDGRRIPESHSSRGVYYPEARQFLIRDRQGEETAKRVLYDLGAREGDRRWQQEPEHFLSPNRLPALVRACLQAGWHLEAEGKAFRKPGKVQVEVSSGIDWFELRGGVDYNGTTVKLPALLAALRRGEQMVRLGDGSYGLLPEEWLSQFGPLAALGVAEPDHLRFRRNQAGLLDVLLAAREEVVCDEAFHRIRDGLRQFDGIHPAAQPAGFAGHLRNYQQEGLGWMEFLRRFGFGGCLADDMGVGKTAQVLALLENRRTLRAAGTGTDAPFGPSLVVVPKSLVFNWKQEAARFTPQLRVLDHTGAGRNSSGFADCDVVLTTYGTLRRDAADFKDLEFDYIVLDEAQAIKNPSTESAKAARLLRGHNRLALSGTPVENHLGELWSIFEFLNPGMLGAVSVFRLAGGTSRNPSDETRRLLAQALRPFILRRTKEQVAAELPPKSEQTIYCEMEAPQRKLYDELRAHYRRSLLTTVAKQGLAKSKIQVLEALLRLRQAACHPGLLDPKRSADPSAKLDVLISRLLEIVEDGYKALVFSQFTSLLAIVRERLDSQGIPYEYLDGQTRDRQRCVERFQNDSGCPLFLISLKAGGLGLNLTAAEYVFLLDPWWNPAVEAQAVDRAHRIGQTKQVFAYRLIARDTVEEKVLQLQSNKRELAAAIISADNSLIGNLQMEDLQLLLS
ncbi:MAG: SNF2-related protein [Bryobacteraceae bacterium]